MEKLSNNNWINFINDFVKHKDNYLLGICLGMELLSSKSFENEMTNGLDLIKTEVKTLIWNVVKNFRMLAGMILKLKKCQIFKNIPNNIDFYFVHSYAMENGNFVVAEFNYGKGYTAAVQKDNIFGVQFHPEKSAMVEN